MFKTEMKNSPFRTIFFLYFGVVILYALLFSLPIYQEKDISFIDAFFLSASALSCTGLSTINIATDLTRYGHYLLLSEVQIGGVGIMVLVAYVYLLIGKELSLPQLKLMSSDQNQKTVKSIQTLMFVILLIAFISELIGFAVLYPSILERYPNNPGEAAFITAFHSISSFTNAGFDLFGNGIVDFRGNNIFLFTTAFLLILGVLGFPTIMELITKRNQKKSLFTKVNLTVHGILLVVGFLLITLFEATNSLKGMSWGDLLTNAFFLSASPRNAGFSTVDTALLAPSSFLLMLFLMFVGGSSSSCAGGIRTTTFAVIMAKIWSIIRGREQTVMFRKAILDEDVNKAFLITTMFAFLFFISIMVLSFVDSIPLGAMSYEVMSALTTTGSSMGITANLSWFSKLWLIGLMVVGRIGMIAFVYLFVSSKKTKTKYISESIIVG